ncbi:hypothetical protein NZD85_03995 [Empedobacter stercoris]|uniref:DUF1569 domain-containing protein n=1 Tax=Empedobacter falsenii TaxID=343874 RepID=A0ABY8V8M2_9FLAO|nr:MULTISPECIES: hypothetical protein [Empedobacter]MCA4776424.1 hypothetical protein [Empedobacter stercoris]MDM1523358.1 hypothetical protein [Empedobacter sp. 225-1]MDM1543257.1 hypothetical protein [Empedobacter sp. 189-2]UWX67774.1 hypothetical protein NZD85_03995 [Empedobacter stercoris]WIH97956.1 hypothetical protein OBA43_03215 [Empedobacter falsenii]
MFLNFDDKENLISKLKTLKVDQQPEWGIMTPQHMVEHLIVTTKLSNGGLSVPCRIPVEQIPQYKAFLLESDQEMQKGIKANGMEGLLDLRYPSLEASIEKLEEEIDKFNTYFENNPDAKITNPVLAEIGYEDWKTFHKKHYTHHFKQFGLL